MYLTLLGTGCPSVHPDRFGSANLIYNNKTKILIDCGSGVTQRLIQAGFSGAEIDCLLLTHLHSDHVIDLYQLIISSWHQYRKKNWKIIGPVGSKKFINSLMDLWSEERNLRINYERRESVEAFKIDIIEINNEGSIIINDIEVEYFRVDHKPVENAYGYNFLNKNNKITISGDTRPCKNINEYAINSNLLLHEVFIEDEILPDKEKRSAETVHNVRDYHTISREVGKIAKKVNAKNLILTHFVPPVFDREKLINIVALDYGKKPIIGEDLMKLDIQGNVL